MSADNMGENLLILTDVLRLYQRGYKLGSYPVSSFVRCIMVAKSSGQAPVASEIVGSILATESVNALPKVVGFLYHVPVTF